MPILSRLPGCVRIVEVSPRDGLQNEPVAIASEKKIAFVNELTGAGIRVIEATSFVTPKTAPRMADADQVMRGVAQRPGAFYPVVVPDERDFQRARDAGCTAIALFTAASEAFSQRNVNTAIDETFARFAPIVERARSSGVCIRGYVSTATGCPCTGDVPPEAVVNVAERLFDLGCAEVELADTISRAKPTRLGALPEHVCSRLPVDRLALHLHDTDGLALANLIIGLDDGITTVDAAAGGLGGCPFAPGGSGNLATARLLKNLLHGLEIDTGINETRLTEAIDQLHAAYPDPGCRDAA